MMTLFSDKMLIFHRCMSGLMPNLIKISWTVSTQYFCCFVSLFQFSMPDDTFYTIAQWDMLFHGEFYHFSPTMIHDEQFMTFFCPKTNNNENPKFELSAKKQQIVAKPATLEFLIQQ
jgi:hypothetical protein